MKKDQKAPKESKDPRMEDARCGCPVAGPVVAIKPGFEGERRGAVDLFTRLDPLVERPVPDAIWCAACWPFAAAVRKAAAA